MGSLDKTFHDALHDAISVKNVGTKLITRKLAEYGITLNEEQLEQLETRLVNASVGDDALTIQIDDLIPDEYDQERIVIDLDDPEELDRLLNEIKDKFTNALPDIIAETSHGVLGHLKIDAPRMLEEHRQQREGFEARLSQTWGKALNLLEMLIVIALEAGDEFNQEYRPKAVEEHNLVFEVLTRLHARACQVAQEVLILLRSGFADGAHARWRTLHEITVVAWFIKEKGNDVAERYLLHQHIESYKAALQHQKYYARLGETPFSTRELARLKAIYDQLVDRFDKAYTKGYGWASVALGNPDPKFDNIEQAVALDHWRPYYKLASHNVHANPKGALYRLGLDPERPPLLLAGASDAGLADPGHGAVISLSQITTALLTMNVNIDRLVICQVMQKLVDESGDAFITAHRKLHRPGRAFGRRRTRRWSRRV
ncbi:MAG: DUF5677 domain-containing protein [Chloroflexota bacterium]|nr:DUF5677 domain-containing protein [Chloroflexota bacterium]